MSSTAANNDPAAKMFSANDIPEIVRLFREADTDGGGGLDMEEFCVAMQKLYGSVDKERLTVLHMQIDTNCDKTVDLGELMDFLLMKNKASECLDYKNQAFPKPFKIITVDHHKAIIRMMFLDFENKRQPDSHSAVPKGQARTFQKGQYISVSSDGIITFWTDNFGSSQSFHVHKTKEKLPFSHKKKIHVNDMVYIRELTQMAFCTNEKKVLFYEFPAHPAACKMSYSLKVDDIVTNMNYWSTGSKGVFSFVDIRGHLYVFISYKIQANGLFYRKTKQTMSEQSHPTISVLSLLKNPSPDFLCVKVPVLNGPCRQIQYFQSLDKFAICSNSSMRMVLVTLPKSHATSKKVFGGRGDQEFFNCVEYSRTAGQIVTGGADGLLRLWFPHQNLSCEHVLKGHVSPVTHIMLNPIDKLFISLSDDLNVRVWSEDGWLCRQSFQAYGMGRSPISSACYNIYNNELVLANSDIGTCLGRGTDVFKNTLTSHDKPLCSALYHSIFKQVVSVCHNGVVTVWDVITGRAVMQFKVTPKHHVGLTAMSFDGPQRRLITVSDDGKVRLWNFNNGTELAVLPLTVPKKVTGIVCINNRMFVSGRDSDIIFDLDLEKNDHRFLKHHYLKDIISMDVHGTLLVTASSNGNVVCWNAETGEALYWLNASTSPRTQMITHSQTGSLSVDKQSLRDKRRFKSTTAQNEILRKVSRQPLVICLKTRKDTIDTATVLTSAVSHIYAWSISSKGGVLGKFRAVKDEGAVVTTMSTDANEKILLTGDSNGRIYMWDIQEFGFKKQADIGPFVEIHGWHVSLSPPSLLGSWQAHPNRVVSVKCDPTCEYIITAGLDCNVLLWTKTGWCRGLFGRDQWDLTQPLPEKKAVRKTKKQTHRAKKKKQISRPFPGSLRPSPRSLLPNFTELCNSIEEVTRQPEIVPMTVAEINAKCAKVQRTMLNLSREIDEVRHSKKHPFNSSEQHLSRSGHATPRPSNATPTTRCSEDTENTPHMQQCAGMVKQQSEKTSKHQQLPPISDKFQLSPGQNQFKPHRPLAPLIRDSDYKQSIIHLNRPKYGRRLINSRYAGQDYQNQLKPQPPQTLLITDHQNYSVDMEQSACVLKQKSGHNSKYILLPPISKKVQLTGHRADLPETSHLPQISDKVQLTGHQTNFKPHAPQTSNQNLKQSSPETAFTCLNRTRSKYGRMLNLPARDEFKMSALTPYPPNTLPDKFRPVQTSRPIRLPPIADKVQLTGHQTHLKPHPPQTPVIRGSTNLKQSSPKTASTYLNRAMSKYGRMLNLQARDEFKALPDKLRPVQTSRPIRLPPIGDKV